MIRSWSYRIRRKNQRESQVPEFLELIRKLARENTKKQPERLASGRITRRENLPPQGS